MWVVGVGDEGWSADSRCLSECTLRGNRSISVSDVCEDEVGVFEGGGVVCQERVELVDGAVCGVDGEGGAEEDRGAGGGVDVVFVEPGIEIGEAHARREMFLGVRFTGWWNEVFLVEMGDGDCDVGFGCFCRDGVGSPPVAHRAMR